MEQGGLVVHCDRIIGSEAAMAVQCVRRKICYAEIPHTSSLIRHNCVHLSS